jgi:hypothetical protein
MGRTSRWVLSCLLVLGLIVVVAGPVVAAPTARQRARSATGYLAAQQQPDGSFVAFSAVGSTADAVLAFRAAGRGGGATRQALRYLRRQVRAGAVAGVGLQAKVVLAYAAAGAPTGYIGGTNLVRAIREALDDTTAETAFDTALGILAVEAAGRAVPADAIAALEQEQCPDGGWAFDAFNPGEDLHCSAGSSDFFLSDTNTTAYAVMALLANDATADVDHAFDFLWAIRDADHGGWGYSWGFETTDANSTGLVLQAFAAADRNPPAAARAALGRLQFPRCGAFAFTFDGDRRGAADLGATIGALPGLLGVAFPFEGGISGPVPTTPPCAT